MAVLTDNHWVGKMGADLVACLAANSVATWDERLVALMVDHWVEWKGTNLVEWWVLNLIALMGEHWVESKVFYWVEQWAANLAEQWAPQ